MAHLKIETILQELGHNAADNRRLQIYLTDSLESPKQNTPQLPFAQWLSNEATEAAKIKNNAPVMVILGNPPYSGESQNKGEWILHLMEDYKKEPTGGRLQEKNPKWLNDDYAKFIRFGQHFIEKNGEGILAYINNHSFLDNPTFRGMRYNLLQTFDKIYIIDLHGNAKKKETAPDGGKDENVFDIQQGVSINIFVKTHNKGTCAHAAVYHTDLYGRRQEKYNFLLENNLQSINWDTLQPKTPQYFFVNKNFENREEYEKGFLINDLFSINSVGIVTAKDTIFVNDKKEDLIKNINENFGSSNENFVQKVSYRPFDRKFVYYDTKLLERPREKIMQHFKRQNIGLIVGRQGQVVGNMQWNLVFVSIQMIDFNVFYRGGGAVFPLYLYHENFGQTEKVTNLNEAIVAKMAESVGADLRVCPNERVCPDERDAHTRGAHTGAPLQNAEQIFDYIYAILHSPSYREKYKEFLKIDFPRIPDPQNAVQFNKMAALGEKLRHLHLMENIAVPNNFTNFPQSGSNKIENSFTEKSGDYHDNKVWINDSQYFDNVPEISWNFYIGGYQPAQKWLKDRKGRTLTYEGIEHYQKIIFVLNETDRIMKEIDLTL
jgi:predicted helicase